VTDTDCPASNFDPVAGAIWPRESKTRIGVSNVTNGPAIGATAATSAAAARPVAAGSSAAAPPAPSNQRREIERNTMNLQDRAVRREYRPVAR
jgi:hypothetical protein